MGDDPEVNSLLLEKLRIAELRLSAAEAAAAQEREARLTAEKARLTAESAAAQEKEARLTAERMRDDDNGFGYLQEKGLPPLQRSSVSISAPHYGNHESIEGEVTTVEATVKIPDAFNKDNLVKTNSSIWKAAKVEAGTRQLGTWNNETHIEAWVKTVLEDIAVILDQEISINTQVSLTLIEHLIPDILLFRIRGTLIGVCEVKQPTFDKDDLGVVNENLVNQIHNYLKQMQYVHGVLTPIGIISTYRQWRICWLKGAHKLMSGNDPPHSDPNVASNVNTLYLSKVYNYNEPALVEVLATTVENMTLSEVNPPSSLIRDDRESEPRRFGFINDVVFRWTLLPQTVNLEYTMPAKHTKNFYFLQDFHGGRDGRVWLAMNDGGRLGVIKLSKDRTYEKEVESWKVIWEQDDVRTMTLMGANAMLMPVVFHACKSDRTIVFRPIGPKWSGDTTTTVNDIRNSEVKCNFDESLEKFFSNPPLVAEEAITQMARKGYQHDDLKWGHVGLLPFSKGKVWGVKPVLIDLHQVTYFKKDLKGEALDSKVQEVIKSSLEALMKEI